MEKHFSKSPVTPLSIPAFTASEKLLAAILEIKKLGKDDKLAVMTYLTARLRLQKLDVYKDILFDILELEE